MSFWDQAPELQDLRGWSRLTENGFGAVIGAAVGPGRLGRRRDRLADHTTEVVEIQEGVERTWREARTATDQDMVDDSIDEYLREAGLPPRPHGYVWFIRAPARLADEADPIDVISREINRSPAASPAEVLAEARRIAAEFDG